MLSVKQGGMKYYFLGLWYDSTWDWTPVSWEEYENIISKITNKGSAVVMLNKEYYQTDTQEILSDELTIN